MRKSDWPFFIWLEFEISCKVVEIVLFFPPTVSEGQSTAFWFFFVAIWNLLPLTFLSSAGHLEFIHAITPSSFSCCITVCQWPLFSALPFLCSLSSAGKLREKNPTEIQNPHHAGVQDMKYFAIIPTAVIPKHIPANEQWTALTHLVFPFTWHDHTVKTVVNAHSFLVVFTLVWFHVYWGEFPAEKMRHSIVKGH